MVEKLELDIIWARLTSKQLIRDAVMKCGSVCMLESKHCLVTDRDPSKIQTRVFLMNF